MAAGSAVFCFRPFLPLLPLPRTVPPPMLPPPDTSLLPLGPSSSPSPAPLSFRQSPTTSATAVRSVPASVLLPVHDAGPPEKERDGAFGGEGSSPPADVWWACHPAAALAKVLFAKPGYYNAKVVVAEDEPEDRLIDRFRRASARAGIFRECHRRRFFEDKQAELKRRARYAAVRRAREAARLRRLAGVERISVGSNPPFSPRGKKKRKKEKKQRQPREASTDEEEEDDNWELPEGEIPYCR